MYLKSIEVHGFKSFANKIYFKFEEGITGIVGPNGSGKSNVADAVRWVLGEQRIKELRGASMQDVIFSGTELRKPLSFAFVAITLDNSDKQLPIDYEEVTVARRIYRSGESEYLINGTPCRLKDVNELFYDTGIGKEGYSIIGQGQIDKILSGRPEDRRELFDKAAGIVKFKRRKVAAQKKLESEEANLVRVSDILNELEKQVAPLEKQAETAKTYLKHKEELKSLDVNVFLLENGRLNKQLEDVAGKQQIAADDFAKTNEEFDKIKEEYSEVEGRIDALNQTIESARGQLTDSSVLKEKLEGEIKLLKEQIKSLKTNEATLVDHLNEVNRDKAKRIEERDKILDEKNKNDAAVKSISKDYEEAKEELAKVTAKIAELTDKIEEDKAGIISELNSRASVKSQLGRFDTLKEEMNIKKAELNSKFLSAKANEQKHDEEIKRLQEERDRINSEIEKMNETLLSQDEAVEKIREEIADKDKETRDLQVDYHRDKAALEALTNLTERYEGYGGSVRSVMEQKATEKGIIGVVADIIKVDPKYETAIETALGGNIQNIVTDTEATAKKMINFLKKNRLGRATFLPLNGLSNPQEFKAKDALKEPGALGMADTLVHVDKKYADVATAMLGRIIVVDNVDNALKIARKFDYTIRMVTLEGELLVPGGAISGGTFKNNSNLLGRRREIEELERKTKETLKKIDILLDEIEKKKQQRNKMRMEIEDCKARLQRKYIEQNTANLNVAKAEESKKEALFGSKALAEEESQMEVKLKEIEDSKQATIDSLAESEKHEAELNKEIETLQDALKNERDKESDYSAELAKRDLEVNKMMQAQDFVNQNLQRYEDEISRFEIDAKELNGKIEAGKEEIARKEDNISKIEETIIASATSQDKMQEQLKADIEARDEYTKQQKGFFNKREEISQKIAALDKEIFRLNGQKERLEEAVNAQINYMWDEYEVTLSDASSLRDESMTDLNGMKRRITNVKEAIKKLGDVNVNAIEDFRVLMERYTFLKTQHDDLVEAKKNLEGIILDLDEAMRRQFSENFKSINDEFDKVFKELFGGGKGTLELIEGEDILEAGIRIIAQPPGKKLQNMMQLSGGEKALTAIALLFAIQNLKPSPFCLLDEIEAALDESNVDRFAKYLHKLTKHTQFIVITHRRGTMNRADRLYGITMQEKGVSALVSVNLIDKDLDD
ncbi:MAG: chromosome segregation protein SMC [Lachnospiraceae bacterium]|nr:chromosome segregation protein SMC [Lachnospiraceae bacterium]